MPLMSLIVPNIHPGLNAKTQIRQEVSSCKAGRHFKQQTDMKSGQQSELESC
jgi:hypothetical protein